MKLSAATASKAAANRATLAFHALKILRDEGLSKRFSSFFVSLQLCWFDMICSFKIELHVFKGDCDAHAASPIKVCLCGEESCHLNFSMMTYNITSNTTGM